MLNFGNIAKVSTETNSFLRAWNIYDEVKFEGISDVVTGNRKDGGTWRAWDFTFTCPQGSYKERIFEPGENGEERRKIANANGHESEMPSDMDRIKYFAVHLVETFAPTKRDKFMEACGKISTFDQFIALLHKVLDGSTITTSLLLAGRNNAGTVYAALPNFVRINSKTGEPFMSERFLGDNLAFTAWELSKKKEYESAKPTPMKDAGGNDIDTDTGDGIDDLDLGDI